MPRREGEEWEYVAKVKQLSKGQWTCKCKYCGHTFDGGPNRIRAHVLGLKGFGVDKCSCAPADVRDVCKKLHAKVSGESSSVPSTDEHDMFVSMTGECNVEQNVASRASRCQYEENEFEESMQHGSAPKRKREGKGVLHRAWESQARDEAMKALRRFFYAEDILFWKVRSPYFLEMFMQLEGQQLHVEVRSIENELARLLEKWKVYGCTIVCDGWSDTRNRPIINAYILKDAILDVSPKNVVQVCMDNVTNCIKAGGLVEAEWPHIFFTHCTCHCLDLLFEDIGNIAWIKSVLEDAQKVVVFVISKPTILALFRKFSSKDLVKQAPTRFAYMFIMLSNMLDERVYNGFRSLTNVSNVILSAFFWRIVKDIIAICAPILKLLRLANREGATMGLIYELTDRMVKEVSKLNISIPEMLDEIKDLCINRWNKMHSPLHAAAYLLHPIWREKCPDNDGEVNNGWIDVLERYTKGDLKKQGTCASPCERNWSTFSLIHTKRRNKLLPKSMEKLAFIHKNLRLASKIKERGFVKMEVTLDMIEKEKDDDRLLKLQDTIEEEGSLRETIMPSTSCIHTEEGSTIAIENLAHNDDDDDDDDDEEEEEKEEEKEYVEEDDYEFIIYFQLHTLFVY
ncbi:hypothetical protein KP509_05G090800 [Ceratopteris richardii]|uniref:DUF659 domain-containing protein n=1 Tax=Ceratopteris richardii TaxID=49495 RepID=A0A8T2UNT8_CERRI|nr:hypothetical protein KP509_05G090800 [Ceratopteris richardii]